MTERSTISRRAAVLGGLGFGGTALAGCTADELAAGLELLGSTGLTQTEAASGVKEALRVGTGAAVSRLSAAGGYLADPSVRIPLPSKLQTARNSLSAIGLASIIDDVEVKMNRAAEAAAPQAKTIFGNAISALTIQDALEIVRGPNDAATRYFQRTMTPDLVSVFTPPMRDQLNRTGAIAAFDRLVARVNAIPLAPQIGETVKSDLVAHGVDEALGGMFFYVGQEEEKIRANPAAYSSAILRRVFS
ncbi:MAG: DUF4197 domain-containing protein [Pseudomonadota bacterium]